jgi:hypothetical protein
MKNENLPEDTIIDLSRPGVVHYIYPTGRKVSERMMYPERFQHENQDPNRSGQ